MPDIEAQIILKQKQSSWTLNRVNGTPIRRGFMDEPIVLNFSHKLENACLYEILLNTAVIYLKTIYSNDEQKFAQALVLVKKDLEAIKN